MLYDTNTYYYKYYNMSSSLRQEAPSRDLIPVAEIPDRSNQVQHATDGQKPLKRRICCVLRLNFNRREFNRHGCGLRLRLFLLALNALNALALG